MPVFGRDLVGFRLRVEAEMPRRAADRLVRGTVPAPPPDRADITVRLRADIEPRRAGHGSGRRIGRMGCAGRAADAFAGGNASEAAAAADRVPGHSAAADRMAADACGAKARCAGTFIEGFGFILDAGSRIVHIRIPPGGPGHPPADGSTGPVPAGGESGCLRTCLHLASASTESPHGRAAAGGTAPKADGHPRHSPVVVAARPDHPGRDWLRTTAYALGLLAELNPPELPLASGAARFVLNLHASCVASPKGALVFCGHRTHGKSTIASELLRGLPLLDDDAVAVVCEIAVGGRTAAGVLVCPHPDERGHLPAESNRGATASASGARRARGTAPEPFLLPIAGLFWLKKSARFAMRKMGRAEAAAGLLSPMLPDMPPESVRNRLRLIGALLDICPCKVLEFRKEREPLVRLLKENGCL